MSKARIQRVAAEIKKEVGSIIHNELNDPRIGFVTITNVELSPDLHAAKVFFGLLGTKNQLRDTEVGLARSASFIRKLLGRRMKLRYIPKIVFKLDEGVEYSIRISEVLEKIKSEGKSDERTKGN